MFKIVQDQPNPLVFYKTFLELDGANMASILSFDSRSMAHLLHEQFESCFSEKYPIFYRNKIGKGDPRLGKFYYRSALGNAIRFEQAKAISEIIKYIVKFQNTFVSSYLFHKYFHIIVAKGISITSLLESRIFCYDFDYDGWPSTHTNDKEYLRPYNGSLLTLRHHY
jgi:hypothetical protein